MSTEAATDRLSRAERERDLFRQLLLLGDADDVAPFVARALELLSSAVGAKQGYFELYGAEGEAPLATALCGLTATEVATVRARLSSGIIHDAVQSGRTVSTASAIDDPRFAGFASVQAQRISAVLCAPLLLASSTPASDAGSIGVIYLEGRDRPGPFSEDDRQLVELCARSLAPWVLKLISTSAQESQEDFTREPRARLDEATRATSRELAGRSQALAEVFRQVVIAAPVPITVLIRGESGTGKSVVARMLHSASPRRAGPFVELNVAALPEALFESELFGAEKGAHSQADSRILGKVEAASGGTLFLDEIGELSLPAQTKLLTFLQNKSFMRLGGREAIRADVRIIAATNAQLEDAVREKRFREDLYYRLNVLEIVMPPLRDRREDIGPIAQAIAARLGDDDSARLMLSRSAVRALADAEWPGNVRQLENVVSRGWAVALSQRSAVIEAWHLFGERKPAVAATSERTALDLSFQDATRQFQATLVEDVLLATSWNVSEAARRLDLSRSHLNELIRGFGLSRKKA